MSTTSYYGGDPWKQATRVYENKILYVWISIYEKKQAVYILRFTYLFWYKQQHFRNKNQKPCNYHYI